MLRRTRTLLLLALVLGGLWPVHAAAGADDGYLMPTMAPDFGPPPYDFKDNWSMLIVFKTTPEAITPLVPKPLVPNPVNAMYLMVSRLRYSTIQYHEMVLGIPAFLNGRMVGYCVYLIVDNDAAMVAGREIWGFPKKMGRIVLEEKDGKVRATVQRGEVNLVTAEMELGNVIEGDPQPDPPVVNLKLIPGIQQDAPPDVKQLTLTAFENVRVHKAYEGKATLSLGGSPLDPLNKIPVVSLLSARYRNYDFTLTYGKVVHDYLRAEQASQGLSTKMATLRSLVLFRK